MTDINEIDLRLIDTTILMIFLGLMRHRQATAVAREMGLTQPAISHALKRLRALYGDQLFLRRAHGLEPTAIARDLEPKVRRIVRLISETLSVEEDFDPKNTSADLKIAAFDYEHSTILPELVTRLRTVSPGIVIHTYPLTSRAALDALVEGQVDMCIGYFEFPTQNAGAFVATDLFTERYVISARQDHPLLSEDRSLGQYAEADYVMISPFGPARNMVDHAFQLRGHRRNIQTTVPSLFAALSIVERSDLAVILPERVAERNARRFNLVHRPLPIDGGEFQVQAVRHIRDARSAMHVWVLDQLQGLIA